MAQIVIAKFKLKNPDLEDQWQELSTGIQQGISQAPGFISRDTGVDEKGVHYCVVKFNSREEREKNMKKSQKMFPEMFKKFNDIVDIDTMEKIEIELDH